MWGLNPRGEREDYTCITDSYNEHSHTLPQIPQYKKNSENVVVPLNVAQNKFHGTV